MKLQEVINTVNELEPSTYSDERITSFINDVEMMILKLVVKPAKYYLFSRLTDQSEYDLPITIDYNNINSVFINNVYIPKVGLSHDEDLPGYRLSENDIFQIFPVVTNDSDSEDVKVVYKVKQDKLDFDTDQDRVLFLESPFDEMYHLYAMAKVNFYNKDFLAYNNFIDQYNDVLEAFKLETIRSEPLNKKSNKMINIW